MVPLGAVAEVRDFADRIWALAALARRVVVPDSGSEGCRFGVTNEEGRGYTLDSFLRKLKG
jgi:hypothetical protein